MTTIDSPWVTTVQVTKYLKISINSFAKQRDLFSLGEHYILIHPKNPRSPKRWHLPKVEAAYKAAQFIK